MERTSSQLHPCTGPTTAFSPCFSMPTGIIFIGCLVLVSWVIQLLPVISVPITGAAIGYLLNLSNFNNYTYGVFGVCDTSRNVCSTSGIGYPVTDLFYYDAMGVDVSDDDLAQIQLPSDATHSISKLLVVHLVAFCSTSALLLTTMLLLLLLYLYTKYPGFMLRNLLPGVMVKLPDTKPQRKNTTPYLEWMLLFALFSFLLTLLAFLADILLFIPRLGALGWIQLIPISLMAFIASLVCLMKRSISSRRHLEEEVYTASKRKSRNGRWANESDSDDGFYIYTNGFYSANNDDRQSLEVHILAGRNELHDLPRVSEDLGDEIALRNMRRES